MHGRAIRHWALVISLIIPAKLASAGGPTHPPRLHVVDYFRMLPRGDGFEAEPEVLLEIMHEDHDLIDQKNGYMQCGGNGAQVPFEVALFRFLDGRPLVLSAGNRMQRAPRTMFPAEDKAGRQFILPRVGKTIVVRDNAGKREDHFTWDGKQFIAEQ